MPNSQKTIFEIEPPIVAKGRAKKQCTCGKWFTLPRAHALRHNSCSIVCRKQNIALLKANKGRSCEICGTEFYPRDWQLKVGQGRFCSHSCGTKNLTQRQSFKVSRAIAAETYKANLAAGKFLRTTGPENPRWKGGLVAARKRAAPKKREKNAAYRKENPHKIREWTQRRRGKKLFHLPRGTIPRLFKLQRGLCALCATALGDNYHTDHIMPLALGGAHEPLNIQLLCQTCNVRKWMFHPVEFAQRNGKLL